MISKARISSKAVKQLDDLATMVSTYKATLVFAPLYLEFAFLLPRIDCYTTVELGDGKGIESLVYEASSI